MALNSSEALVLVCNSTAGFVISPAAKPGGQPLLDPYGNPMPNYFAFPGAATAVWVNMLPIGTTSALYAVKPPRGSTGFVTLQRSVTLGPLLDPVTGGLSSLQQGLPPVLDMGSQRVSWGAMADPSYRWGAANARLRRHHCLMLPPLTLEGRGCHCCACLAH